MAGECVDGDGDRRSHRLDDDRWRAIGRVIKPVSVTASASIARHTLAEIDLFCVLDRACLDALQGISIRRSFVDDQAIHMQDEAARFLNVIISGHVRLSYLMEDGSAVLHDVMPRHAVFGELGILDRSSYPDMATAVGRVSLFSFPSTALLDLAQAHPALSHSLHRAVALRYRAYIALVRDLSLRSLSARLARTLIRMADRLGLWVEHDGRRVQAVGAVVTQTDLGLMARGSRGNVNRTLQVWQRAGWIMLRDRSILLLNREALASLASRDQD